MDELVKDMQDKGLITICPNRPVLELEKLYRSLESLAKTKPLTADTEWWRVRMMLTHGDTAYPLF